MRMADASSAGSAIDEYDWEMNINVDYNRRGNKKGGRTDDSVMALAIKKALDEDLDLVETMVDVGRRYPFCGYGGSFYYWIHNKDHRPYGSWGNGACSDAMLL